jgi:hypothetical protein
MSLTVSVSTAAKQLDLSPATIRRLFHRRTLRGHRATDAPHSHIRISVESIAALQQQLRDRA